MRVCSLRTSCDDPDIHVILLDPEALIKQLLSEEAYMLATSDAPVNPKRLQNSASSSDGSTTGKTPPGKVPTSKSYEIAQLLLSCAHGWGLDRDLDELSVKKLGMLRPIKPLSFGLLTRGRLALMFPGWYVCGHEENIAGALETGANPNEVRGVFF